MPLSDLITITLSTSSVNLSRAGYGVPLILACNAPVGFVERVRTYTTLAAVAVDFATTTPEYLAAAAIFAQSVHPASIKIGRRANKTTQVFVIGITQVLNSTAYKVKVGSTTYSITSGGSATNDAIATSLATAIDAHSGLSAATTGSAGSLVVTITADAAGSWFQVQTLDPLGVASVDYLSIKQTASDPGVGTDLTAILNANKDWYGIINPWCSALEIAATASWAESNGRLYIAATQDSASATASAGGSDIMQTLETSAYVRTGIWYHPDNGQFIDAAIMGRIFPIAAGGENWAYKTLAGVSVYTLTPTQRQNILDKHGNLYETQAGVNITYPGWTSGTTWLDLVRGRDALASGLQEDNFAVLVNNDKVSFDDDGIGLFANATRGTLKRFVGTKLLAANPAPEVTTVSAADTSGSDKTARHYSGLSFTATLAGAVNTLAVSGTLTE